MKYTLLIALSLGLSACSLFTPKRAAEVVPSCFSDGEDQTKICKAQRVNDDSRIVVTRCIGTQNREANPVLRGKCVEKICSEGSNTDCSVKGDIRVLEQYAELVTSNMFADGDSAPSPKRHSAKEKKLKTKAAKSAANVATPAPAAAPAAVAAADSTASASEVDTDPSAVLPPLPEKKVVVEATPTPVPKFTEEEAAAPAMSIALKPAKPSKKKVTAPSAAARAIASVKGDEGFKKVCVAKNDSSAPEILRGKCATRSCSSSGKCSYKGRKEMFDYVARSEAG
ncbi:MAG: hypothetical protein JSU04_11620 [Bdellovibrionales bacterium]|nr:hypothetical protein [Bdellovibrionales bacterium]